MDTVRSSVVRKSHNHYCSRNLIASASSSDNVNGDGSAAASAQGPSPPAVDRDMEDPLQDDGEATASKSLSQPPQPTPEEIANHRVSHIPFRSWCAACVEGRARSYAHKKHDTSHEEVSVPARRST